MIEVKGLSGSRPIVQLTPNEYRAFDQKKSSYRLAIVTDALVEPKLLICRFSIEKEKWVINDDTSIELGIKTIIAAHIELN